MMYYFKVFAVAVLSVSSHSLYGQKHGTTDDELRKKILVDSLTQVIYRDTAKFAGENIIYDAAGRRNANPYSMLYVVNGRYMYLLDVIASDRVVEFVNEVPDIDKIESIAVLPEEKARYIFGTFAQNGVAAIRLKKRTAFHPYVAGFIKTGRKTGDNFSKNKAPGITIR